MVKRKHYIHLPIIPSLYQNAKKFHKQHNAWLLNCVNQILDLKEYCFFFEDLCQESSLSPLHFRARTFWGSWSPDLWTPHTNMVCSYLTCACPQTTRPLPLCSFTCRSAQAGWTQTFMRTEKFAWAFWGPGPGVEARCGHQSRTFCKFWFLYKVIPVYNINNVSPCLDHLLKLISHDVDRLPKNVRWGCSLQQLFT